MKHKPMDFSEFDQLFSYDSNTGEIRNKIDRGTGRVGVTAKAGEIATTNNGDGRLRVQFIRDGIMDGYLAHRVAWLLHHRICPGNMQIDHIDGCPSNNKILNLRLVDHQENMMNQRKRKNNTSGVTGVSWDKNAGKWIVKISDRGERQYLGLFEDKFEAICCRKSTERRLGYHKNHGK